jgi:hypothetical protein
MGSVGMAGLLGCFVVNSAHARAAKQVTCKKRHAKVMQVDQHRCLLAFSFAAPDSGAWLREAMANSASLWSILFQHETAGFNRRQWVEQLQLFGTASRLPPYETAHISYLLGLSCRCSGTSAYLC